MKLYLKQKVFSWRDRFYAKDENNNDRYTLKVNYSHGVKSCISTI